jgi:hypothetical protein
MPFQLFAEVGEPAASFALELIEAVAKPAECLLVLRSRRSRNSTFSSIVVALVPWIAET